MPRRVSKVVNNGCDMAAVAYTEEDRPRITISSFVSRNEIAISTAAPAYAELARATAKVVAALTVVMAHL